LSQDYVAIFGRRYLYCAKYEQTSSPHRVEDRVCLWVFWFQVLAERTKAKYQGIV
jgi:hypothetical protein